MFFATSIEIPTHFAEPKRLWQPRPRRSRSCGRWRFSSKPPSLERTSARRSSVSLRIPPQNSKSALCCSCPKDGSICFLTSACRSQLSKPHINLQTLSASATQPGTGDARPRAACFTYSHTHVAAWPRSHSHATRWRERLKVPLTADNCVSSPLIAPFLLISFNFLAEMNAKFAAANAAAAQVSASDHSLK